LPGPGKKGGFLNEKKKSSPQARRADLVIVTPAAFSTAPRQESLGAIGEGAMAENGKGHRVNALCRRGTRADRGRLSRRAVDITGPQQYESVLDACIARCGPLH